MANYQLKNDAIDTIPVMGKDAAGDPVALPIGRTPTLVNSDPQSLNAIMDGNNLVINALVDTATNITLEIDDGTLTPFVFEIDIVEDLDPTSVVLDLTNVTHATQPRPSSTPAPTPTPTPAPTDAPVPTPEPTPTPAPTDAPAPTPG